MVADGPHGGVLEQEEKTAAEALLARLCRGDLAALSALYDLFAPRMLALGTKMLGDGRDAEDVLHDVFVEAWRHAAEFNGTRGNVEAWLILRMRSRCIDRIRSAERRRRVSMEEAELPVAEVDPWAQERHAVQRAMSTLPQEQRDVVMLTYFEGLSGPEIAARFGVPLGTVKSRLASAVTRLRAALGRGGT